MAADLYLASWFCCPRPATHYQPRCPFGRRKNKWRDPWEQKGWGRGCCVRHTCCGGLKVESTPASLNRVLLRYHLTLSTIGLRCLLSVQDDRHDKEWHRRKGMYVCFVFSSHLSGGSPLEQGETCAGSFFFMFLCCPTGLLPAVLALVFYREKGSAVPIPRQHQSRILSTHEVLQL